MLSPIVQDSSLLPLVGVWPCLSPSVDDHMKRPAKHHRPRQLLPNQLSNTTWAWGSSLHAEEVHHFELLLLELVFILT